MIADPSARKEEVLLLEVRRKIYSAIGYFPGIHFRELQRKVRIATGNLEYHLDYLAKADLIKAEKAKPNKRFFPLGLNDSERKILGVLRQNNFRKIIIKILNDGTLTHKEISEYLKISPSSATWYISQLIERNILAASKNGRGKRFDVRDRAEVIKIIIAHSESFFDKIVDKFVDAWVN